MKGKKPLCGEFCNDTYYCQNFVVIVVFFQKKLTTLINYSFRMTILSSFQVHTDSEQMLRKNRQNIRQNEH